MKPLITNFLIALILIALIGGVWSFFVSDLNTNYTAPLDYDNDTMELFDHMNALQGNISETKDRVEKLETSNFIDLLGAIFNSGYQALKTVGSSFDVFSSMMEYGFNKMPIGGGAINLFRGAFGAIVLVLIFIGVFIGAIIKRDL